MAGEDVAARRAEQDHLVGLRLSADLHARRAEGHAGHRKAGRGWSFAQETKHVLSRHVTFDRIALDDGGVARRHLVGDSDVRPIRRPFDVIGDLDLGLVAESREKGSVLPLRDSLRSREVAERCEIIPLPE